MKLSRQELVKIVTLRTIGNFLILFSLFSIVKTLHQPITQEVRYFFDRITHKQYIVVSVSQTKPLSSQQPSLLALFDRQQTQILNPPDTYFSVVIPKIGATSKVIANVDASDEKQYLASLKQGVAHAQGTAFPGEGGHVFLFAHSTDYFWNVGTYNAVFYLLSKLEVGDEIDLFHQNRRFVYKVLGRKIVEPSQVEYLTRKTNNEFLTLQTCWPAGTTLKRLLVFASRAVE